MNAILIKIQKFIEQAITEDLLSLSNTKSNSQVANTKAIIAVLRDLTNLVMQLNKASEKMKGDSELDLVFSQEDQEFFNQLLDKLTKTSA